MGGEDLGDEYPNASELVFEFREPHLDADISVDEELADLFRGSSLGTETEHDKLKYDKPYP